MNETENKPEIVLFYNKNKGGTDSFDKKCHDYTVTRRPLDGLCESCTVFWINAM